MDRNGAKTLERAPPIPIAIPGNFVQPVPPLINCGPISLPVSLVVQRPSALGHRGLQKPIWDPPIPTPLLLSNYGGKVRKWSVPKRAS